LTQKCGATTAERNVTSERSGGTGDFRGEDARPPVAPPPVAAFNLSLKVYHIVVAKSFVRDTHTRGQFFETTKNHRSVLPPSSQNRSKYDCS
jgi:hypothetical protein